MSWNTHDLFAIFVAVSGVLLAVGVWKQKIARLEKDMEALEARISNALALEVLLKTMRDDIRELKGKVETMGESVSALNERTGRKVSEPSRPPREPPSEIPYFRKPKEPK